MQITNEGLKKHKEKGLFFVLPLKRTIFACKNNLI